MAENISKRFNAHVKDFPDEAVNFRKIFEYELFGIALKQVSPYIFFLSRKLLHIEILFPKLASQREHKHNKRDCQIIIWDDHI